MPFLRRNLSTLAEWDPILIDYARAIALMQERPLRAPTSWRGQAAVHGFHDGLIEPGDAPVDPANIEGYWNQCQHGSWFFLPWHRGYLAAFEAIVRDAVVQTGGPAAWVLPYWDLGRTEWLRLRPEFCSSQAWQSCGRRACRRRRRTAGATLGHHSDGERWSSVRTAFPTAA